MRPKKPLKMPKGVREPDGKMRISVVLDRQVFDDICCYGLNQGWKFSDAINDLAGCGVRDMKDAGEFERPAAGRGMARPGVVGHGEVRLGKVG